MNFIIDELSKGTDYDEKIWTLKDKFGDIIPEVVLSYFNKTHFDNFIYALQSAKNTYKSKIKELNDFT